MPILAAEAFPSSAEVRPLFATQAAGVSQGKEGQAVQSNIAEICKHWSVLTRGEKLASAVGSPREVNQDQESADELNHYHSVPLEPVGKIRVKFGGVTDLQPRRFELDEDGQ